MSVSIKTPPTSVIMKASGFARVLHSIEVSAELEITDAGYIMYVSGRLFAFDVALTISANYGPLPMRSFHVYGKLLLGLQLDAIIGPALDFIKKGADLATKAMTVLQDVLAKARAVLVSVKSTLDDALNAVATNQAKVDSAILQH